MRLVKNILLLIALLVSAEALAQNFEADSVYYTPMPVETKKTERQIKVFQDTITNNTPLAYFFTLNVGSLIGCNSCSEGKEITFTASTLHGITLGKKLRTGLGIGLDSYYQWQTMPIFGSISWDVFGTKNTSAVFIQFQYGWSKPWRNESHQEYGYKDADGGRMVSTQIGYRLKYHDVRISLSVGTKYQRVFAHYAYPTYYYTTEGVMIQGNPSTTTVQQSMNRLQVVLSVGWK